jgi:hypothetical protein
MKLSCRPHFFALAVLAVTSAAAQTTTLAETTATEATPTTAVITPTLNVSAVTTTIAATITTSTNPPQAVNVAYFRGLPGKPALKEEPKEIVIVRTKNTANNVAAQVALNVVMLALGGGAGLSGFSKYELKGDAIEELKDRSNIRNPIPTDFVQKVQQLVNGWTEGKPEYKQGRYKNVLMVAGGSSKLVYESLSGDDSDKYRLVTELAISKRKENAGLISFRPFVELDCGGGSKTILTEKQWAEDDYAKVKIELDATLKSCETKLAEKLPELLKE